MMESVIPGNYKEWRHCITVECGLELTPAFIEERIASLQNPKDYKTKQFVQLYGPQYLQQVLAWFQQARDALN